MLCTKCSAVVRPVVAIDIDGTLADYHGMLLNLACDYLGIAPQDRPEPTYDGTSNMGDWMCQTFGIDRSDYRDIKLALRQGGYKRYMPAIENVEGFMGGLERLGCEVWITTTRPYMRHDSVDPDTREWLRRHNVAYDGLLYHDDKYLRLGDYVRRDRVIAVLDDLPEQYDSAAHLYGRHVPILRRTFWNRGVYRDTIASTLQEALDAVRERHATWASRHYAGDPTGTAATGREAVSFDVSTMPLGDPPPPPLHSVPPPEEAS